MKRLIWIPMLAVTVVLLIAGNAMAFPFIAVEGVVDIGSATITDNGDGTSLLEGINYEFTVTDNWFNAEMVGLSLEFENDVFQYVSNAYDYNPNGWTSILWPSDKTLYSISFTLGNMTIGVGESLSFLVDVVVTNEDLTDASTWTQDWTAFDTKGGGDGGTTAPVPEPATMLMLGTGLAGFAAVRRRKLKNG